MRRHFCAHPTLEELDRARHRIRQLARLAESEILVRVRTLPPEALGMAFVEEALVAAEHALPHRPHRSLTWARVARTALDTTDALNTPQEALAIAFQANAERLMGRLRTARVRFARARQALRTSSVLDLDVLARVHHLEAELFLDLDLPASAVHRLRQAASLAHTLGDSYAHVRLLVTIATVLLDRREFEPAAGHAHRALRLIRHHGHSALYPVARELLVDALHGAARVN